MYAVIDVETTGSFHGSDKITEIAVYVFDGEKIVDEYATLVNPEKEIPWNITRLTGITNEMVANAPRFFEIAKRIVELTDNKVFVAHNAAFDYGVLKNEFSQLGFDYSRTTLCTVRMSRKLLPGHASYSLGKLTRSLGIELNNHHRAAADALATVRILEKLIAAHGTIKIEDQVTVQSKVHTLPPQLDAAVVARLPELCGIYFFHDQDGNLLYVGKSKNIKKRVLSHFAKSNSRKANELRRRVQDVSFELSGNELMALVLETEAIKKLSPPFNRAQKKKNMLYGLVKSKSSEGYDALQARKISDDDEALIMAASMEEAKNILARRMSKYNLCQKYCGQHNVKFGCFLYGIHQCRGACVGKESVETYNERVAEAVNELGTPEKNFAIVGRGKIHGEFSVIMIEEGKYSGYGFFNPEFVSMDKEGLSFVVDRKPDDKDILQFIRHHILNSGEGKVIYFNSEPGKNISAY